jgi:hypothetical protein
MQLFATIGIMAVLGSGMPSEAMAQSNAGEHPGERVYADFCARCHADPNRLRGRATGLDDANRRTSMERFLARHHAPDAGTRKTLVDYLAALKHP